MKLFNQLLVAPAALGLLAPLSAIASEVNISEISSYSGIEETVEEEVFDHNTFAIPLATNSTTEDNYVSPAAFEAAAGRALMPAETTQRRPPTQRGFGRRCARALRA